MNNQDKLDGARQDVIHRAGGLISMADAATHLGVPVSEVRRRIRDGTLLSLPTSFGAQLPRAQFAPNSGTLPGLETVLKAMNVVGPWGKAQLLLDDDVLGPLRAGRVEEAARAAGSYLPS